MKRLLIFIGIVLSVILMIFGIYCMVNEYSFTYSALNYHNGTTLKNYHYTQTKDEIKLKFGSFNGKKEYSIKVRDFEDLSISGEIDDAPFKLELYDDDHNLIDSLSSEDIPYEFDLSTLDTGRIKFVLEGEFSGNLTFDLE